jgi:hypothetical protein
MLVRGFAEVEAIMTHKFPVFVVQIPTRPTVPYTADGGVEDLIGIQTVARQHAPRPHHTVVTGVLVGAPRHGADFRLDSLFLHTLVFHTRVTPLRVSGQLLPAARATDTAVCVVMQPFEATVILPLAHLLHGLVGGGDRTGLLAQLCFTALIVERPELRIL